MSETPPHSNVGEMHPPQSDNGFGERDYRKKHDNLERSRSRSKDHYNRDVREKDKERERDKKKRYVFFYIIIFLFLIKLIYIYLKGIDLGIVTAKGKVKTTIAIATMKVEKKIVIKGRGIEIAIGIEIVIEIKKETAIARGKTMTMTGIETLVLVGVILEATRVAADHVVMITIVGGSAVHIVVLIDVIGFVIATVADGREAVALKVEGLNVAAGNVNIVKEMV